MDNNKYNKGKIYALYHKDICIYVGSTTALLSKRFSGHKSSLKTEKKTTKLCQYLIQYDFNEFHIELIENYSCNSKDELCKKEKEVYRQYLKEGKILLNTLSPITEDFERKEYLKDYMKDYNPKYRENNLEKIKEQKKIIYQNNADHIKEKSNKRYYEKKEEILQQQKENYDKKKEGLKEKKECECGDKVRIDSMLRHKQSQRHITKMEKLETNNDESKEDS